MIMAMQFAGDVCYSAGKYKNAQGEEKTRFVKCGAYFQSEGRTGIKLEFLPIGVDPVKGLWFSLFPKKEDKPKETPKNNANHNDTSEDQVPF